MAIGARQLEKRIDRIGDLPTFPSVVKRISILVEDRKSSAADIGNLIARDQVISAKILRLINSPVYGFPSRISSVTHALVLLGFTVVKGLVLSTAVFDTFGRPLRGLWEHSLGCAVICRQLARELREPEPEEVMIAGLLHDLGKAIVSVLVPDEFDAAVARAKEEHCHIAAAERMIYEIDHARVAGLIASQWHLPVKLSEPLTYHHRPDLAKKCLRETAIVHVADILTRCMGYGWSGDDTMPPFDESAYRSLKLSARQLDQILERSETEFSAGVDVLTELGPGK